MSKFYVIGKFSREYIKAMMQNPDQDRVPSVKKNDGSYWCYLS